MTIEERDQPAIVKTARADAVIQAKGLYAEISQSERFNLKRAYELGKILLGIKDNGDHGDLAATGIPSQRASEYMRIAKCQATDVITFDSIRDALDKISEVSESCETPGAGGITESTGNLREPGDETPYDQAANDAEAKLASAAEKVAKNGSAALRRAVRTAEVDLFDAAAIVGESLVKQDKALDEVRLGKAKTLAAAMAKINKPKKSAPTAEVKDALGQVVPKRCRDAFADPGLRELIDEVEQAESVLRAAAWIDRATKLTDHYQFLLVTQFRESTLEAIHRVQVALESLKAGMPYAVCPKCKGEENGKVCRGCRGGGHIPLHRYQELTSA